MPDAGAATDMTRKGLGAVGELAQLVVDLDCLSDRLAPDAWPLSRRLQTVVAELCGVLEALLAAESDRDDAPIAAMAVARGIRKAHRPDIVPAADSLAKLADEIVPRLEALQKRVDEIARTPLPPQTITRGFTGVLKQADAGAASFTGDDVVAALARMSDDERTLTLIKAARFNPITPVSRPAGFIPR